jgi:predicted house-cleaning noncanonical NTP pyrophosphatase (MazG superfamily)
MPDNKEKSISFSELFPQLSEEEQPEAEENLRQYLAVVRRIFEHVQANDPKILTELRRRAKLRKEKAHK